MKSRTWKRVLAAVCAGVAAVSMAACGGGANSTAKDGVIINSVMNSTSQASLNYNPFSSTALTGVVGALYEPLFYMNNLKDDPTKLEPLMGKSYTISDDAKTIDVTIRDGEKWSDGEPYTTEDVAYTFNLLNSNKALNTSGFAGSAKVLSDTEVRITLDKPESVNALSYLSGTMIVPKHVWEKIDDPVTYTNKDAVGSVNGLAWTSVGGVVMPLEVLVLDGKGRIELTGSLGDVMKESAKIAVSYCRSVADKYGIDKDFYEKKDLHIHAPEGAVPKDGPSAGVTMITGIISALGNIKVRSDVAMTGEITLSGKVLPIGGLREKTMAAYKAGVKTIIVPFANKGDLDDVDDTVKLCCEFVFAKTIQDVLDVALIPNSKNNVPLELLSKNEPERKKLTV